MKFDKYVHKGDSSEKLVDILLDAEISTNQQTMFSYKTIKGPIILTARITSETEDSLELSNVIVSNDKISSTEYYEMATISKKYIVGVFQ